MKNLLLLILITSVVLFGCKKLFEDENLEKSFLSTSSSTNCEGPVRYRDMIFSNTSISLVSGIVFKDTVSGHYSINDNKRVILKYDFFQPIEGTQNAGLLRPLIVLLHGGGFTDSTNTRQTMEHEARRFAKYGYCVASLDYRIDTRLTDTISYNTLGSKVVYTAIYRAIQDVRLAIRRAKSEASIGKIDTNYIFVGGVSAGGITSLHTAYLQDGEIPESLVPVSQLGGLDFGGYNQHSSKVKGVFAHAGGLTGLEFIDQAGTPAFNLMSRKDSYFSINCQNLDSFFRRIYICGANAVSQALTSKSVNNKLILLDDFGITVNKPENFSQFSHGSVFGNHVFPQRADTSFQNRDVDSTVKWLYYTFSPNICQ